MKPQLEELERRNSPDPGPWGFNIVEVQAPPNIAVSSATTAPFAAAIFDANVLLWLGQFHLPSLGIPYTGANEVIRFDVTPQQWAALFPGSTPTIGHWVVPLPGGSVPLLFAPTDSVDPQIATPGYQFSRGEQFDLACLRFGWQFSDPEPGDFPASHVYDLAYFPNGPQAGQPYTPPNFLLSDVLFAEGNPLFWAAV